MRDDLLERWRQRARTAVHAAVLLLAAAWLLDRWLPPALPDADDHASVVTDRHGVPLRAFADAQGRWRYRITPEEVSPIYLQTLIAYEDRGFYDHPGVNPKALLRAAWQRVRYGRVVSGGSTLTMQVARILDPHSRDVGGKLRQMLRALQLEWRLPKRDILDLYLNHAPFGGTIEGVEAASWAYLGKSSRQLSQAEAALLTVLPQAPSRLRPDRSPQAAQIARDKVLHRLHTQGLLSDAELADAKLETVIARRLQQPMLAALLAQRLHDDQPRQALLRSTLDAELQRGLEARTEAYFSALPERTSAAVLVVDNETLEARAYLGSLRFGDEHRLGHVDMVRAVRSPGSTLKPFLYAMAMDEGLVHAQSLLIDAPQGFGADGAYRPVNFDPKFNGPVSVSEALRLSLNVPAVDVLDRIGPVRFAAKLENAGLPLRLPDGATPNLSIILGGTGASLEDLVGAYAAFQREGRAGEVRYLRNAPRSDRHLMSPGSAWIVRRILQEGDQSTLDDDLFVRGSRGRIAWKTGTSYGFRDAWAIGGDARHTVGVWIGRPDGTALPGQYGAITALPLMFQVFAGLPQENHVATEDRPPASVRKTVICWPLGTEFDADRTESCHRRREAWVLRDSVPPTLPERDTRRWQAGVQSLRVDALSGLRLSDWCSDSHPSVQKTVVRWPALAYPWLPQRWREAGQTPALSPDCKADGWQAVESLVIDGPAPNSLLRSPPQIKELPEVHLRALGADSRVDWLVNGERVGSSRSSEGFIHRFEQAGPQRVVAISESGAWAELSVRVAE